MKTLAASLIPRVLVLPPLIAALTIVSASPTPTVAQGETPAAGHHAPAGRPVSLTPVDENHFAFETEDIKGTIRLDGAYHGITQLVDKHSGRQVIDQRYAALNLFKLFAVNQCMGQPRDMERTTKVSADWVEVTWPPTDTHQAGIVARYQVRRPNAVDVTVTVRSQGSYRGYEVFMPSYFDKRLEPHIYLQPVRNRSDEPQLVRPMVNDVFRGTLLVFARDAHAARHCLDGRWQRSERGYPTVQPSPVRYYGHCLALLKHPDNDLGVVLMARPGDCFAISTRYHVLDEADRMTTYSAFDFALFGKDLSPGQVQTATVRLALTSLDSQMSQPLDLYRSFLAEKEPSAEQQPSTPQHAAPGPPKGKSP